MKGESQKINADTSSHKRAGKRLVGRETPVVKSEEQEREK